jgi:serine/threonine protein kinase
MEDNCLHIVMDYAAQGDLQTAISNKVGPCMALLTGQVASGKLFPEDVVLGWFIQVALALKCIHDMNILHRDIKVWLLAAALTPAAAERVPHQEWSGQQLVPYPCFSLRSDRARLPFTGIAKLGDFGIAKVRYFNHHLIILFN